MIFKIHPNESYVDGMVLIAANSYPRAEEIFRNVSNKDIWPEQDIDEHFLDESTEIQMHLCDLPKNSSGYTWYMADMIQIPSKEENHFIGREEGFISGAFHDG